MPVIHFNGVVCPCTYDYNERFPFGDLNRQTFQEIWWGEPCQTMRRLLRSRDPGFHFCHECSFAYVGGSCIDETIVGAFFYDRQEAPA